MSTTDSGSNKKFMPKIRILEDRVANQIAAGEVVERPASVAKELIENSIDSGAAKIEVEFRNGGKSYLRVEDNGCGMGSDQVLLSLERHATSKIRKASDLHEMLTFGFRGEALPSIASVSRFTMRSRSKDTKEGSEILVNGGKMIHMKECGMPLGTRIEVSHLFNSVPGRRKFLKTEVTEATHLIHLAKLYALAHPDITFSLMDESRTLFRSPGCRELKERVREIFGRAFSDSLAPIHRETADFKIAGLVGLPGQSRSTRKEMIFFVNRRPVESKALAYAVLDAYHTYAPKGRFPPVILFLSIDPGLIDVNVHPAKKEIRFREEPKVRNFILESLLRKNEELAGEVRQKVSQVKLEKDTLSEKLVPKMDARALELFKIKEKADSPNIVSDNNKPPSAKIFVPTDSSALLKNAHSSMSSNFIFTKLVGSRGDAESQWRFIDRPKGNLSLFSTSQGIVALHLRAAFERIRFEQLEDALEGRISSGSQRLLLPESIELDGIDKANLEKGTEGLRSLGFEIEEFGRNFYRLEGCPRWIELGQSMKFVVDFLDIAREQGGAMRIDFFAKEALARQVSSDTDDLHSFSDEATIRLADQLLNCRNPYSCPKGKPTYYEIPFRDFETRLKRNL